MTDYYEYMLPAWTICPIINGDYDTLTDEQEQALDKFLAQVGKLGAGVWDIPEPWSEEHFEFTYNDIDRYAGEAYRCKYTIF